MLGRWMVCIGGVLGVLCACGQEAVVPAGTDGSGAGGTVSWSLGQVGYEATQADGGSVSRGVQQPHAALATAVPQMAAPVVAVWPNPAQDAVQLRWEKPLPAGAAYALHAATGALLQHGALRGSAAHIPLHTVAVGSYLLLITAPGRPHERFTIQKQ